MRGVKIAERDGGRAARLGKAGHRRVGDLPRLGQVKGEEVIGYVLSVR